MAKEIKFDNELHSKLLNGVKILAKSVKTTLGPRGRNVMIQSEYGAPRITKDGVSVAKEIDLEDSFENMGAQMVKEVAGRTANKAGDGTTTATVLAEAIYSEGLRRINTGCNPIYVKRGIDKAANIVVETLRGYSKPITTSEEIRQVGTISANGDNEIGNLIASAMEKVGNDGVITVQESKGIDTDLKVVEGMQFDKGFVSPYFLKEGETEVVLENAYILIHDKRISNIKDIMPVLQDVSKDGRPLLMIAEDIEGEVLPTVVINNARGVISCCAVKAPSFGDTRKAMLEDIAILTGGEFITEDTGKKLESTTIAQLGRAAKIVINKDSTTIVEGAGSADAITARVSLIRKQIEDAVSDYDKNKLKERLAKLAGGVAILSVGAASEIELKEKKDRIDDALHATKAAVESGILPGGGIALLNAIDAVSLGAMNAANEDESIGFRIVEDALKKPIITLTENAGVSGDVIISDIQRMRTENNKLTFGYDVATDQYVDMIEKGIIDPTNVTITAIESAASVAGLLLTTECAMAKIPEKNPAPVMPAGMPPMM